MAQNQTSQESLPPQLTHEEHEALHGFAAPPPRRVQKKAQADKGKPQLEWANIGFLALVLIGLAGLAYFVPETRISVAIGSGVFLSLLFLVMLPSLIHGFLELRLSYWLTKYGIVALSYPARREIKVDCGTQGPYGWTDYILHYNFLTEAGETVTGTYTSSNFVDEGISVLVVYHPGNPKKHRLYRELQHEPVQFDGDINRQQTR